MNNVTNNTTVTVVPGEALIIKLWETLAEKGIGAYLQPWHEKRLADTRNQIRHDEIVMLAKAQEKAKAIRATGSTAVTGELLLTNGPTSNNENRIEPTLDLSGFSSIASNIEAADAVRKEINVCKAIIVAEEALMRDEHEPTEQTIDDDWLYSWRENAGRVSSEELQDLWGRILAGESKKPGSYSFRTLEFLKGLDKYEADLINRIAQFNVASIIFKNQNNILEREGVNYAELMALQDIGILSGVESNTLHTVLNSTEQDRFMRVLVSGDRAIFLENPDAKKTLNVAAYKITSIGIQVLKLASVQSNFEYLEAIAKYFAGQDLKVQIVDWAPLTNTTGIASNHIVIKQ